MDFSKEFLIKFEEGFELTESVTRAVEQMFLTNAVWGVASKDLVNRKDWLWFKKFIKEAKDYTGFSSVEAIVDTEEKSPLYTKRLSSLSLKDKEKIKTIAKWLDSNAEVLGI